MILTKTGEISPIYVQLDKEDGNQYLTATITDKDKNIVSTVNMDAVPGVLGLYIGYYQFTVEGLYSVKFVVYSDVARTNFNGRYAIGEETAKVSNLEENVDKLFNEKVGMPVAEFD